MERSDLMSANAAIFKDQGQALNSAASNNCKVVVVGNPANTNALIASSWAPNIPVENFSALTRLDHNRAIAQLANKTSSAVKDINGVIIWGNHSTTQYPDLHHATVKGTPALDIINDQQWYENEYIPRVAKRGAEIIAARGASSAASAASATIDHIRDWHLGTGVNQYTSMAVMSDGSYDCPQGIVTSFPVTTSNGKWSVVKDLQLNDFSRSKVDASTKELLEEREMVSNMLGPRS